MFLLNKIKRISPIVFLSILAVLGAVFTIVYLAYTGNQNQVYTDIIFESTSAMGSNKSAEVFLLYFLSFFGIFAYGIYYFLRVYNKKQTDNEESSFSTPGFIFHLI